TTRRPPKSAGTAEQPPAPSSREPHSVKQWTVAAPHRGDFLEHDLHADAHELGNFRVRRLGVLDVAFRLDVDIGFADLDEVPHDLEHFLVASSVRVEVEPAK